MDDFFLLGVLAGVDPGLLAVAVILLSQPRPHQKLLAFWLGGIGLSACTGIVLVLVLGRVDFPDLFSWVSPGLEVAIGVGVLVVAC